MPRYECVCGAKYRFSEAHRGRKGKCRKCDAVFTLVDESDPIPIAGEPEIKVSIDSMSARQAGVAQPILYPSIAPGPCVIIKSDEDTRAKGPGGYWQSLLWTGLFAAQPRDLAIFLIICVIVSAFEGLFGFTSTMFMGTGILLLGVWLLYKGWYASVRFAVVASAAAGDEHLPDLALGSNWLEDLFVPAIQWAGSWVAVMLPAIGFTIYYAYSLGGNQWSSSWILGTPAPNAFNVVDENAFWGCVGLGLFMWPMTILCVALGGLSTLWRIDLMCLTILRTLPVYLLTVVIVVASEGGGLLLQTAIYSSIAPLNASGGLAPLGDRMIAAFSSNAIRVYATIVMLRAIGLYYHHFKHRFTWNWG